PGGIGSFVAEVERSRDQGVGPRFQGACRRQADRTASRIAHRLAGERQGGDLEPGAETGATVRIALPVGDQAGYAAQGVAIESEVLVLSQDRELVAFLATGDPRGQIHLDL